MRKSILIAAATLTLANAAGRSSADIRGDMFVAQAMTGGAGSNSPAAAARPHTEIAPGTTGEERERDPRTSRDNGTGNPLAGDEQNRARPNADVRPGGSTSPPVGGSSAPHATQR
jgi:hypothetical protein